MKLFTLPNIITLGNLLCGCLAIVCAFNGNLVWAAYLVGIAAVLDFLDGFVARALKQHSPIGKDLDSLADMVTFGVVPGVVMFQMMNIWVNVHDVEGLFPHANQFTEASWMKFLPYAAFLITLFSALRLAKFNNDTRQSDSFIGVPTPANSILICSVPLIIKQISTEGWTIYPPPSTGLPLQQLGEQLVPYHAQLIDSIVSNIWVLLGIVVIMSYLLISEIPLFALKFKSFKWKGNEIRYSFLGVAVIMIVLLKYIALPLVIVLYVLLSIANNLVSRNRTRETGNENR